MSKYNPISYLANYDDETFRKECEEEFYKRHQEVLLRKELEKQRKEKLYKIWAKIYGIKYANRLKNIEDQLQKITTEKEKEEWETFHWPEEEFEDLLEEDDFEDLFEDKFEDKFEEEEWETSWPEEEDFENVKWELVCPEEFEEEFEEEIEEEIEEEEK